MSCPACFRGGKAYGEPKGTIESLYGHQTYVAAPAPTSASTIIFITDIFGLDLVNNKLLADDYAAATGFRVLVPDIIPGGPLTPDVLEWFDVVFAPTPFFNVKRQLSRAFNLARGLAYGIPFFYRAFPSKKVCFDPCLAYARRVKADLPEGAKLGIAGFCWGGYQSINMCAHPSIEGGNEPLVDAQFCAHPSGLNAPDDIINGVMKYKTPFSIAQGTEDSVLKQPKLEEAAALLRQKAGPGKGQNGYNYQIKYYEGAGHGFSVRATPGNEAEARGADEAKEQAIDWFKKWL